MLFYSTSFPRDCVGALLTIGKQLLKLWAVDRQRVERVNGASRRRVAYTCLADELSASLICLLPLMLASDDAKVALRLPLEFALGLQPLPYRV